MKKKSALCTPTHAISTILAIDIVLGVAILFRSSSSFTAFVHFWWPFRAVSLLSLISRGIHPVRLLLCVRECVHEEPARPLIVGGDHIDATANHTPIQWCAHDEEEEGDDDDDQQPQQEQEKQQRQEGQNRYKGDDHPRGIQRL